MSDRPGDETNFADGEVKAWMSRDGKKVMTQVDMLITAQWGKLGEKDKAEHPLALVLRGSVTDYHARAKEWREYGDNMHERAMKAERLLRKYKEQFGDIEACDGHIPPGVYFSKEKNQFYNHRGHGLGVEFNDRWLPRKAEFPTNLHEALQEYGNSVARSSETAGNPSKRAGSGRKTRQELG